MDCVGLNATFFVRDNVRVCRVYEHVIEMVNEMFHKQKCMLIFLRFCKIINTK